MELDETDWTETRAELFKAKVGGQLLLDKLEAVAREILDVAGVKAAAGARLKF